MKVLAIADRPARTPIWETIDRERPDIIITLGDLDFFILQDLKVVTDIPKIGVYGNHCSGMYFESLGIENMHLATKTIHGVTFGGFEGSLRYKPGHQPMFTDEEASALLKDFPPVDVMIAHSPPRGIHDEPGDPVHQGLEGLRTYVLKNHPRYFLHGHTYVSTSTLEDLLETTRVVHVYADQILTLDV